MELFVEDLGYTTRCEVHSIYPVLHTTWKRISLFFWKNFLRFRLVQSAEWLGYGPHVRRIRVTFPKKVTFSTVSRSILRHTKPLIQWVPMVLSLELKRPLHEVDYSPLSSAEVKNVWSYTSTLSYGFMLWCLIEHREFIFMEFVTMKNTVFYNETPCIFVEVYRCFGGGHCFHLQSGRISLLTRLTVRPWIWKQCVPPNRR
jgi:hypothetical protein